MFAIMISKTTKFMTAVVSAFKTTFATMISKTIEHVTAFVAAFKTAFATSSKSTASSYADRYREGYNAAVEASKQAT